MNIVGLADFTAEYLASGHFVYLSSLDINGAFDAVPQCMLIRPASGLLARVINVPHKRGF